MSKVCMHAELPGVRAETTQPQLYIYPVFAPYITKQ